MELRRRRRKKSRLSLGRVEVTPLLENVQGLLNVKDTTFLVFHLVTLLCIVYTFSRIRRILLKTVKQQIEAGEQGDKSVTQAAANPTATQVAAKPDSEAKTLAVAAIKQGKKHTHKTNQPVDADLGEGSSMPPDTQSRVKPTDTQSEAEATDDTKSEAKPTDTKSEAQPTGTRSGPQPTATRSGGKNEGAQEQVLEEMALADADEQCEAAILSLSIEPAPTLHDMLEGWKHSPTICHGLIQAALEKGEALEHLQYIDDIIVWGNMAIEVFEKGEIIQILLKAGFAIKKSKVKGPAREIQFLEVKWQDRRRQIPTEVINKITAMLQLTEGLHLKDDNWNFVSVDNSEQGTWPRVKGKLIVVGDCKHTPKEIEILPGTFDNNPGKFVLWLRCTHPPTFLPKGQTVAQIIPTWEHLEEDNIPTACPVHNITEVKPQVGCELQVGDEAINITGLLHTDMDVTVIPAKHWLSRWALGNVAGHMQGIGGMQLAKQSKSVVQIKGPKGQLASLHPFVLDYRKPLLGRDLMAQWGVTIDIPDPPQDFWAAVAEERPTHKLNWKTDAPVWVEQWLLSKQKLKALEELVEEQLAKGHIVETTSPWNSPVFVIRKPGKDKWRLLQDLRQINNVIEDMGSLQPGMPTPTMLPQNWKLAVIDIKDCFFHIPLHPDDAPRFAFSVPTVNREAPRKCYHWRVLPQGMKVSPIICQWYVASLLSPVRVAAEKAIIHHYMDDVLVCAPTNDVLSHALDLTINALVVAGFELQEDKVQRMPPWRYLGLEIGKRTIVPQKLEIKAKIQTLADVHQLCGALNWVRPWLGLTTEDLAPLFNLLKGGEELSSPRELTPEAKEALERVQHLMSTRQAHRCDPDLPFKFIIMGKLPHLHGVIFQWRNNIKKDQGREDPLLIIEWVFLSHQRSKRMTRPQELVAELIRKARVRIRELAGCDFECIHIPIGLRSGQITKAMLEHLLQENEALQFALDSFTGQISIHWPAHKIFNQDAKFTLNLKDVRSRKPLEALTVFTDASGKSHKSVMTWKDPQTQQWEADVAEVEGSPQVAELAAVVRAFERFPEPFNLVTDSAYVAGVVSRADQAILQEVSNTALFELLSKLVKLVSHREQPFFVMHTRSHTDLPGFIAEGNRRADALAAPAAMAPLPSIFEQAKLSHQLHHQNAPGLVRRFHITREQAKAIVATCPSCNQHALPTLSAGVNPRGLNSCELWQTDVTHIPQFGRSKYVHVSVDTFSGAVFASAHAGEKTLDAIKHLIQAFSFMGIPKELKTDNGPAYRSKEFCSFLQQWGVGHKTGIPHSPTGQAVVERTHREIKRVLNQQQPVLKTETPQTRLARALFTLNFLNSTFEFLNPPIVRHFGANPQLNIKERPPVMVWDPETGRTEGPHDLVTWGRGYACVSTPTGPRWLPSKWVAQATEGEGGSSQLTELKAVQLALDIAEREKWPKLYLYTDSWMVANALWGWLGKWKKANWQHRGKPIWAADEWKDITSWVEKLPVKVHYVDAHVPKSWANEEHQNKTQLETVSSCSLCCCLKKETNPQLTTATLQEVVESDKVTSESFSPG
ncbi:hypothetical protein DUI87_01590 [Hirundo rustica rustica]|uniref:Uncharacterized protein n=1 Tax=Hirundo rustica rustica TaxID=333673 RepID=A0A3M0L5W0_HIRRU|nr:hypothetical protein DUI87_01590 [Hirundo rustica rustica]